MVPESRKVIQSLEPYLPGKPIEELARELGLKPSEIVKLASNENPLGPSDRVKDCLVQSASSIHRYPDGSGFNLKSALAKYLKVPMQSITLGNGSNDVLDMIGRAYLEVGTNALFSQYAFAVYPIITQCAGAESRVIPATNHAHDLDAFHDAIDDNTRVIFLANPNNPTGTWFDHDTLNGWLKKIPERILVVLDEAYVEYVTPDHQDMPNSLALMQKYKNLVVTRTFSKIHGLAALRVGYALAIPEITELLNRVRQPFNVNALALSAAEVALLDQEHVARSQFSNMNGMKQWRQGLDKLGLKYLPSRANFIAFETDHFSLDLYQALLLQGVILRPLQGYDMPQFLRATIGSPEENEKGIAALKKALHD